MRTIDQIRQLLVGKNAISKEKLAPLLVDYSEAIAVANTRLAKCEELLKRGLRSEAIQAASIEPNLLDLVAELDLPEIEEIEETAQFLGLQAPPPLAVDVAMQLQEAIVSEQPLESILRQHRRLAIAKAPLSWRIKVLRRIAELDPGNPIWEEDIESWEKVRIKQLSSEIKDAVKLGDCDKCRGFLEELTAPWRIAVPSELETLCRRTLDKHRKQQLLDSLQAVAARLDEQYCSMDEKGATATRKQWLELCRQYGPIPSELSLQADPALAWIEERESQREREQQFNVACANLHQLLKPGTPLIQVHRAYQLAGQFGFELDASLEQLYRSFVAERQLASQRRTRLLAMGIVGVILICGGGLAFSLWRQSVLATQQRVVAELRDLVERKQFPEAGKFLEALPQRLPDWKSIPELANLSAQVEVAIAAEEERRRQFTRYLEQATSEDASQIADDALREAEKLAQTDLEKGQAFRLRRMRKEWEQERDAQEFAKLKSELVEISKLVDRVEISGGTTDELEELGAITTRMRKLKEDYPHAGAIGMQQWKILWERVQSLEDAITSTRERKERRQYATERLRDASNLSEFRERLNDYLLAHEQSALKKDIELAIAEESCWQLAETWNSWTQDYASAVRDGLSVDESAKLGERLGQFLVTCQMDSQLESISLHKASLESFATRKDKLQAFADQLFDETEYVDLGTVLFRGQKTEEGGNEVSSALQRVFVRASDESERVNIALKEKASSNGPTGLFVVTYANGTQKNRGFEGTWNFSDYPRETCNFVFAEIKNREAEFIDDWESQWSDLILKVAQENRLDLMIKQDLTLRMLQTASDGSAWYGRLVAPAITELQGAKPQWRQWYREAVFQSEFPADSKVSSCLERAASAVNKWHDEQKRLGDSKMSFVGVILPQQETPLRILIHKNVRASDGVLVTLCKSADGFKTELTAVAQLKGGEVYPTNRLVNQANGRPLFLLTEIDLKK